MTYKFPQFSETFTDPNFYLNAVRDDVRSRQLTAEMCFEHECHTYAVEVDYQYGETWDDRQVFDFAMGEINKYKI